ncbi:MAG TPA: XrtA system polysaccharide chain length determinant [Sphingomonas sp.]|nr:XrtA system polysaccharide chain length determinant [Sphingomonas sp.]
MNGLYDEMRVALHGIWRRRWVALAAAWAIAILGWLAVAQIPNSYTSHARVFVDLQSVLPGKIGITSAEQQQSIDTIRQTLTSAVNLQKVVRGTSLASTVATDQDMAARVGGLQQAIKITAQQNNLFAIDATASNPKLAHDIVEKLIDIFVDQNMADDRDENSATLKFLDAQLADRQEQLQEADQKRQDFQNRYLAALPGTGALDDRISAAHSQLAQVDSQLAAAQSALGTVNAQLAGTTPTVAGPGGVVGGPAAARVAAIQGQLADARARGWTDNYPDVIALKSQLAAAQAAAKHEPAGVATVGGTPNPMYLSLRSMQADKQATVASLSQQKTQLQHDLDALNAKLASDPGVAAQQAQIERDYQVLKDQYDKMLAAREDVRLRGQVQTQTDAVKFSVIDPPTSPTVPTSPNRPLLLTGVLIVALGGGIGVAFALGQLKTTYPTAARLEAASGLPVIGSIGEVVTAGQAALRRQRLRYFAGALGGLGVAYVALLGVEFLQRGLAA